MDFFDDFSKKVGNTINKAVDKTKQVTENTVNVSKLKNEKKNAEKILDTCYRQLGKSYYENSHNNCDDIYKEIILIIDKQIEILAKTEKELDIINGIRRCPQCNKEVNEESVFCDGCGVRLPDYKAENAEADDITIDEDAVDNQNSNIEEKLQEDNISEAEFDKSESNKKICKYCGSEVPEWAAFCTECGKKYE